MNTKLTKLVFVALVAPLMGGCFHPYITAVDLNHPNAPEGMPYYLPKPYIIISKNIRYIPTPTVGLTQTASIPNTFDPGAQKSGGGNGTGGNGSGSGSTNTPSTDTGSKPKQKTGGASGGTSNVVQAAAVPSNQNASGNQDNSQSAGSSAVPIYNGQVMGPASITVVPSTPLPDGLTPQTFYTYQIVFLPDLTQKYGLRVKGGVGEMRATLNMVNGWMFTGPGPVYFKDSSTAEIATANWTGADSALESAAKIVSTIYGIPSIGGSGSSTNKQLQAGSVPGRSYEIQDYAQIWIYEGSLNTNGSSMTWKLITGTNNATATIKRQYLGLDNTQQAGGGGTGGTQNDRQPKDSFSDVTENVNKLISSLGIQNLTASKSSQNGAGYMTTVNRVPTTDENTKLAPGLKSLKVELSAMQ